MSRRVLHVVPALAPRYGGPSVATLGMCRALRDVGTGILIASTDADGPGRLPVVTGREVQYDGVPVVFFRRQASEGFKYSRPLARWLGERVTDFDLLHIHAVFSHASVAAGRACRRRGVPYILRPLGTLVAENVQHKAIRKGALLAFGARQLIVGASAIHYTSPDEHRLTEAAFPLAPAGRVVPLGLDDGIDARTDGAEDRERPYVLTIARLHPIKGLDLLIDAFAAANRTVDHPSWRLIIAGDGDAAYTEGLQRRARQTGAPVEFRGWVSGRDKVALLRGASLFALASERESFGIAVAEAMASGVPVLVTPGVSLASNVREANAGWIADRTTTDLARALASAMASAVDRTERGRRGAGVAAGFRWPAVAETLAALYDEVISSPPGQIPHDTSALAGTWEPSAHPSREGRA